MDLSKQMQILALSRKGVNVFLGHFEPLKVVALTVGSSVLLYRMYEMVKFSEEGILVAAKKKFFKLIKKIPWVERRISEELEKTMSGLRKDLTLQLKGLSYQKELPSSGWEKKKILDEVATLLRLAEFKGVSGISHKPGKEREEVVTEVFSMTAFTNPLNPDVYPGIRKMEAEVVRMTANLFRGGAEVCGTMTSGGTESLILAVLAYRGYAEENRGVTRPNLVMPVTGHVGLDKAGHLLGVAVRHVPVDPLTLVPRMKDLRAACDSNTIMLLASAPQYAHGIMDPVTDIAALGCQLNIPVHVDACLGGFLIVFSHQLGIGLEPFDFTVRGVTSISADTHKFGYAPKGSSVIMYSDKKYIHHQYFVSTEWTGGIFISPTLAGSRSGGIIAATWAAMVNHGVQGYVQASEKIFRTVETVKQRISKIKGLRVLGNPRVCIIAFTSDDFHIYKIADEMKEKGWMISCIQNPNACQLYIVPNLVREGVIESFLKDLEISAERAMAGPRELSGRAAVYGMAQTIPDKSLVADLATGFLDIIYSTNT